MMHNITKKEYLRDPCGTCATAFWKNSYFKKPDGVEIVHEKAMPQINADDFHIKRYFRLMHTLKNIETQELPKNYYFQTVNIQTQKGTVAHLINRCYENTNIAQKQVDAWTKYKVFDNNLWIFIYEKSSPYPVALGIADFDDTIKEGSLEWIQALPEERGKGLGQALVSKLLSRLALKADFVTVSGEVDNKTKPEMLYRKCGFTGEDIWYVLTLK